MDNKIRYFYHTINILGRSMDNGLEALEFKHEYLENQSRRDNIKIVGVEEKNSEKTWDDKEEVVKKIIKEKLGMDDMVIERTHRVREKTSHAPGSHLGLPHVEALTLICLGP